MEILVTSVSPSQIMAGKEGDNFSRSMRKQKPRHGDFGALSFSVSTGGGNEGDNLSRSVRKQKPKKREIIDIDYSTPDADGQTSNNLCTRCEKTINK